MSTRRTKKQQRQFEEGIKALMGFIAIVSYLIFQSFTVTFIAVGISIVVIGYIFYIQAKRRNERLRKSGIEEIDKMSGVQFEEYLSQLFTSQGYKSEVTNASGDYGADLLLSKNGKSIVVQAKRYNKNVGIKAVQEVRTALDYYKANEAWVVTNSSFTQQAIKQANSSNVKLIDREELIDMILELNPTAGSKKVTVKAEKTVRPMICDRCGSKMVLRSGKKGQY